MYFEGLWVATVKRGVLVPSPEWWKHLRWWMKRRFWKKHRKAEARLVRRAVVGEKVDG